MATVYLGLGSNLGDRQKNLTQALKLISRRARIERVSSLFETEPVGFKEQPCFLNAVCRISTELDPGELLAFLKEIEVKSGRIASFPDGPRTLDIDILFYADKLINDPLLTIPHPSLHQRAFVLVPLVEIAPELIHPKYKRTMSELLKNLKNQSGVSKWVEAREIKA